MKKTVRLPIHKGLAAKWNVLTTNKQTGTITIHECQNSLGGVYLEHFNYPHDRDYVYIELDDELKGRSDLHQMMIRKISDESLAIVIDNELFKALSMFSMQTSDDLLARNNVQVLNGLFIYIKLLDMIYTTARNTIYEHRQKKSKLNELLLTATEESINNGSLQIKGFEPWCLLKNNEINQIDEQISNYIKKYLVPYYKQFYKQSPKRLPTNSEFDRIMNAVKHVLNHIPLYIGLPSWVQMKDMDPIQPLMNLNISCNHFQATTYEKDILYNVLNGADDLDFILKEIKSIYIQHMNEKLMKNLFNEHTQHYSKEIELPCPNLKTMQPTEIIQYVHDVKTYINYQCEKDLMINSQTVQFVLQSINKDENKLNIQLKIHATADTH